MTDPFDRLHRPTSPAEPRREFVDGLRDRLAALLDQPSSGLSAADVERDQETDELTGGVIEMDAIARGPGNRRRIAVAAIVVAAAVALVVGVIVAADDDDPDVVDVVDTTTSTGSPTSSSTSSATSTTAPPPGAGSSLPAVQTFESTGGQGFDAPRQPYSPVIAGDSTWTLFQDAPMERRDKRTGELIETIPLVGGSLEEVGKSAAAFGSLWVAVASGGGAVTRLDAASGDVVATIPIPGGLFSDATSYVSDVAVAADGVWVLSAAAGGADRQLVRIDPQTNSVAASLPAGRFAASLAYGSGSLWVTRLDGTVSRIDPADGRELAKISQSTTRNVAVATDDSVWIFGDSSGRFRLVRIDPATNSVVADLSVSDQESRGPWDVAVGGGFVWVNAVDALLIKVDPATNTVVARYGPGTGLGGISVDDEAVWVSGHWQNKLFRLPLR